MTIEKITVNQISTSHVFKEIAVEGRINKIWPIKVKPIDAAFRCEWCDDITIIKQSIDDKLLKPFECGNENCGRKNRFKLIPEKSTWIDEQKMELQDFNPPEKGIMVIVRGKELIDTIPAVYTHVIIGGTIRVIEDNGSIYDRVLEANHIKTINRIILLREIIRQIQEEYKDAAPLDEIFFRAEQDGFKKETVEDFMRKLKSAGEIYESSNNQFRVV